jgi:CheY-like chemotaxis protein
LEAGQLNMQPTTFSLRTLIEDTIASLQSLIINHRLVVNVNIDRTRNWNIHSFELSLKQILMNILGNAVKFTENGRIEVDVSVTESGRIDIDIKDTGAGIPEEHQKRLFTAFSQADSSIARKFGGTGLGLVLSRKLAQMIRGDVELISSRVNSGSWFRIRFQPLLFSPNLRSEREPCEFRTAKTIVSAALILENVDVLIAEDCKDNQTLLRLFLERAGAKVHIASDGHAAVALASSRTFDVILMDIQMPGVDGYTATQQLRERGYSNPIIALTAHVLDDEKRRCISSGCDDYLSKPVDPALLVKTIARFAKAKVVGSIK